MTKETQDGPSPAVLARARIFSEMACPHTGFPAHTCDQCLASFAESEAKRATRVKDEALDLAIAWHESGNCAGIMCTFPLDILKLARSRVPAQPAAPFVNGFVDGDPTRYGEACPRGCQQQGEHIHIPSSVRAEAAQPAAQEAAKHDGLIPLDETWPQRRAEMLASVRRSERLTGEDMATRVGAAQETEPARCGLIHAESGQACAEPIVGHRQSNGYRIHNGPSVTWVTDDREPVSVQPKRRPECPASLFPRACTCPEPRR